MIREELELELDPNNNHHVSQASKKRKNVKRRDSDSYSDSDMINKYIVAELDMLKLEMAKIQIFNMVPESIVLEPIGQLITQTSLNTMIQFDLEDEQAHWHNPENVILNINQEFRNNCIIYILNEFKKWEISKTTRYLAVEYFDQFLCKYSTFNGSYSLIAAACLKLACKIQEGCVPSNNLLAFSLGLENFYSDFKEKDFKKAEILLLEALEWKTIITTTYSFLNLLYYKTNCSLYKSIHYQVSIDINNYINLTLYDINMLRFSPSVRAAAILAISFQKLMVSDWENLYNLVPDKMDKIQNCIACIADFEWKIKRNNNYHIFNNNGKYGLLDRNINLENSFKVKV